MKGEVQMEATIDKHKITFRLLEEEREQLQNMADSTGRNMSQMIREILFNRREVRNAKRRNT